MTFVRRLFAAVAVAALASAATAAPKRVLLVTHSGGFVHASVTTAEKTLNEIADKHNITVTTWRYTGPMGPDFEKNKARFEQSTKETITPAQCGRINKETLKNFDCVLFFTTGSGPNTKKKDVGPLTPDELEDLKAWVKAGGAFCGTHCASDTGYDTPYGELIGGYFKTHPPGLQTIKFHLDDPTHPAVAPFKEGMEYTDEIYVFTDSPYARDKVKVLLSIQKGQFEEVLANLKKKNPNFNPAPSTRADGDYAISWVKDYGKGKVFYTSLGHDKKVWADEKFQAHLLAGMKWAMGESKP